MKQNEEVKLAQKGSKDAFVHLIRSVEGSMYRIAKSMLKSDAECADVIQEAILKAYQSIHSLKEPQYFKTWMIRIVINECKIILKSQKRLILSDDFENNVRHQVLDAHNRIELQECIDELDNQLKVITVLYYFEDLPIKEIAKILNTPEGTIKSRLHRAREKLAHFMNEKDERGVCYE